MRHLPALLLLLFPWSLIAHDTWVIPSNFRPQPGTTVQVKIATGEAFPASEVAVTPDRILHFTSRTYVGVRKVQGYRVEGQFLVADLTPDLHGHNILVAETKPCVLELPAQEFTQYLRAEEMKAILSQRSQQGKSDAPGRERYRKVAKAVLCVGDATDTTFLAAEGLWLEIIPEQSPCRLRAGDLLEVRVFFEGQPLANARVVAGFPGVTGHAYPVRARTDAEGRAAIVVDRPGAWFIRILHMVAAVDDPEADWHSAFSTLTFEIPR
jgi:uncharacterized GH25 family protein